MVGGHLKRKKHNPTYKLLIRTQKMETPGYLSQLTYKRPTKEKHSLHLLF